MGNWSDVPEGFESRQDGEQTTWFDPEWSDLPERLGTLAGQPDSEGVSTGRGESWVLDSPAGAVRVRKYRRGGALGKLLPDRFSNPERFQRELHVALTLSRRGLPVPRPVAIHWNAAGEGWIAYEEIGDAVNLLERLRGGSPLARPRLRAIATAIRQLHDAGLDHVDLHVGNLLCGSDQVWIIDFDKSKLTEGPLPDAKRLANLRRLLRSVLKWPESRAGITRADRLRFLRTYMSDDARLKDTAARCSRLPLRHRIKASLRGQN
jgi:tRNA A-37 threonylcarbamoyl transferase component Bud32